MVGLPNPAVTLDLIAGPVVTLLTPNPTIRQCNNRTSTGSDLSVRENSIPTLVNNTIVHNNGGEGEDVYFL